MRKMRRWRQPGMARRTRIGLQPGVGCVVLTRGGWRSYRRVAARHGGGGVHRWRHLAACRRWRTWPFRPTARSSRLSGRARKVEPIGGSADRYRDSGRSASRRTKLRDVEWIDDDNLLATISSTSLPPFGIYGDKHEWYQLVAYNVSKQPCGILCHFEVDNEETFNVVVGEPRCVMFEDTRCYMRRATTSPIGRCLVCSRFPIPIGGARLIARGPEPSPTG